MRPIDLHKIYMDMTMVVPAYDTKRWADCVISLAGEKWEALEPEDIPKLLASPAPNQSDQPACIVYEACKRYMEGQAL